MDIKTISYQKDLGWSEDFPLLDSEHTLLIIFSSPHFIDNPQPIIELVERFPHSKIIGCSSAGEIIGSSIHDNSLSVAIIKFRDTKIKISSSKIFAIEDSLEVGKKIIDQLKAEDLTSVFVLSDGLLINGTELVKGLNSLDKKIIITGGLAGDGDRFKKTWVINDGKIETNTVIAAGFYGNKIHIGYASKGGWDIFGPERFITKSKGNVLYELDHKPALTLYKEYLGDRAKDLPATGLLFPLAIRENSLSSKQVVRTILAVDEKTNSLIFAGDIPQGYLAQLMRANFDRLITGANEAGLNAFNFLDKESKINPNHTLSIAISCVGRRLLLGERTEEETQAVLDSLPSGTEQVGFYSYGELSPQGAGTCDLHNQTMTLTIFSEEEEPA